MPEPEPDPEDVRVYEIPRLRPFVPVGRGIDEDILALCAILIAAVLSLALYLIPIWLVWRWLSGR